MQIMPNRRFFGFHLTLKILSQSINFKEWYHTTCTTVMSFPVRVIINIVRDAANTGPTCGIAFNML